MALYQYIPPHLAIHQAPLLAFCLAKSSKSSISAQEVKTSIWNCPPSTTVSCTMDTWQLGSIIPFLIKVINNANHCLSLTEAQREEAKKAQMGRANE